MADLEDVLSVLVATITQVVYPMGTGSPSITGGGIKIYAGWPTPADLDKDLKDGLSQITVFPTDFETNTTRYLDTWNVQPIPPPTIILAANGENVTVGGTVTTPQNVALIVDNLPAAYSLQAGDTPTSIATALVSLLAGQGLTAFNTGPVVTIPTAKHITARVGMWASSYREISSQERLFCITAWCSTPAARAILVPPIDLALKQRPFIFFSEGASGRLRYRDSPFVDRFEKHDVYRRDLRYTVDWPTTEVGLDPQITIVQINLRAPDDLLLKQVNL